MIKNHFRLIDFCFSVLLLCWFFLPIRIITLDSNSLIFFPFSLPISVCHSNAPLWQKIPVFALYLVPLFSIYRITAFYIKEKLSFAESPTGGFACTLRILTSIIMLTTNLVCSVVYSDDGKWIFSHGRFAQASFFLAAFINICSVLILLAILNYHNPIFREYQEFRKTNSEEVVKSFFDVFFKIRVKLFLAFVGLISLIIIALSFTLLRNYRKTIIEAVGDGARTQAEIASSSYRINVGDTIALFEFINRQNELNNKAKFKFNNLTIYTNRKQIYYLDDTKPMTQNFVAEFSTQHPDIQFPEHKPILPEQSVEWIKKIHAGTISQEILLDSTITFVSPIIINDSLIKNNVRIRKERLLGFTVIEFNLETIMRPYYKTRTLVFILTAVFLYLAIILTWIVGNYIVNPLLFLRMNVRKTSNSLSRMIKGEERISQAALDYKDCVSGRDEIKMLSSEIGELITVLRGVLPYISAATLKHSEKGESSSSRKELAFLFTDIRGFTTLCEGLNPEEVVDVLNRYLDLETDIILKNHGDVDKFVGDEVMAFFDGPKKELNACNAAMELRSAMMQEKEIRQQNNLPVVSIGIGINTGDVVFGSVGAQDRKDFTSIGDTVNLAARLEGANKAYGSKSLITEAVYNKVKNDFICRELDLITVKGKTKPVKIYEILQSSKKATDKIIQIKTLFETGLAHYRKRDWKKAESFFAKNVDLYKDEPSQVYLERISHFKKETPPENWDGVFRMTVK